MARVDTFNKGKLNKDDEYYTRYDDIEAELKHYRNDFNGKCVLQRMNDIFVDGGIHQTIATDRTTSDFQRFLLLISGPEFFKVFDF